MAAIIVLSLLMQAGFGTDKTLLVVDNANGISAGDILQITEELLQVVSVTGNNITVVRGYNNTEIVDHLDDIAVTLITKTYRFTKDSIINFGSSSAYVDSYDAAKQQPTVYYANEGDLEITSNSIFVDESVPTKQALIDSVTTSSLRFRFRKDGDTEWFKNLSLDVQRTYRYIFDTSDASLLNRHLKFYSNVYRTRKLLQAFESVEKPGNNNSYTSFQPGLWHSYRWN